MYFLYIIINCWFCLDINECLEELHSCAFRCQNTPGSFRCICPKGYQLSADGEHCEGANHCTFINYFFIFLPSTRLLGNNDSLICTLKASSKVLKTVLSVNNRYALTRYGRISVDSLWIVNLNSQGVIFENDYCCWWMLNDFSRSLYVFTVTMSSSGW